MLIQALLEMGLYWAGDSQSRHGPARVPDIDRAHLYFSRIRAYNPDASQWAWHPVLRSYLSTGSKDAKVEEQKFQKRLLAQRLGRSE